MLFGAKSGRPYAEHMALEVSASRTLATACGSYARALGFTQVPPSLRCALTTANIIYEPLRGHRHVQVCGIANSTLQRRSAAPPLISHPAPLATFRLFWRATALSTLLLGCTWRARRA